MTRPARQGTMMPSRPKKMAKTGSKRLGEELRRLRGTRTLREVCEIARTPPLRGHIVPLSEAGICEIETGKSMPSMQTMLALATVYRTSIGQLSAYITEERLAGDTWSGASYDELAPTFTELMGRGDWHAAVSVAWHAEQLASSPREAMRWRANRASCMGHLGLREQAIQLLTECSEEADLRFDQRLAVVHNLAAAHVASGNLRTADVLAADAVRQARMHSDTPGHGLVALLVLRANILLEQFEAGLTDERGVREALRLLDEATGAWPQEDVAGRSRLNLLQAQANLFLGNAPIASREASCLLDEAKSAGDRHLQARCWMLLADTAAVRGDARGLMTSLSAAHEIGVELGDVDITFASAYRLFKAHRATRPGTATKYWKVTTATFPLISARTPLAREYEAAARARG